MRALILLMALCLASQAQAFKVGGLKVPGTSGGSDSDSAVNWDDVAGTGQNAIVDIYKGTQLLVRSTATMARSIGLKEEAAVLEAEAGKIQEDGSASGGFKLGEAVKLTEDTQDAIKARMGEVGDLTAEQQKTLGEALAQYGIGGFRYLKGVKSIKDVASQASSAPMTKIAQFTDIIAIAPTAAKGAKAFFGQLPQIVKVMRKKGVKFDDKDMPGTAKF